jgi:hypothetical protein
VTNYQLLRMAWLIGTCMPVLAWVVVTRTVLSQLAAGVSTGRRKASTFLHSRPLRNARTRTQPGINVSSRPSPGSRRLALLPTSTLSMTWARHSHVPTCRVVST